MMIFFLVLVLILTVPLLLNKGAGSFKISGVSLAPEDAIVLYKGVGGYVQAVGESNYQPALKMARSNAIKNDEHLMFWAIIEPDNENPHDENAVVIKYRGEKLAYLCKSDAKMFRASYSEAISRNLPMAARAALTGGVPGKPTIGLMLDCYINEQKIYKKKKQIPL